MNTSERSYPSGPLVFISSVTTASGALIFLENVILLVFVSRMIFGHGSSTDKYGMLKYTFTICINDTLAGIALFVNGFVRVSGKMTAYICAYSNFFALSLQIMSQGNIACICAQRYLSARNLRKLYVKRHPWHVRALIAVNTVLGILSLASFIAFSSVQYIPLHSSAPCVLSAVSIGNNILRAIGAVFLFGIVFTLIADVFCAMAIHRLKLEMDVVVQPTNSFQISQEHSGPPSLKKGQQKIVFTMLYIVVVFNVSVLPAFVGYMIFISGTPLSPSVQRCFLISMFMNSFVTPVIVAYRVKDIRDALKIACRKMQIWKH